LSRRQVWPKGGAAPEPPHGPRRYLWLSPSSLRATTLMRSWETTQTGDAHALVEAQQHVCVRMCANACKRPSWRAYADEHVPSLPPFQLYQERGSACNLAATGASSWGAACRLIHTACQLWRGATPLLYECKHAGVAADGHEQQQQQQQQQQHVHAAGCKFAAHHTIKRLKAHSSSMSSAVSCRRAKSMQQWARRHSCTRRFKAPQPRRARSATQSSQSKHIARNAPCWPRARNAHC